MSAFFALGETRGRSYAVSFPDKNTTQVVVFGARPAHQDALIINLPTLIRGQLVVSFADFVHLETDRPVTPSEVL
jgi:hypothetical protein